LCRGQVAGPDGFHHLAELLPAVVRLPG
jgi:hypothetical protein